MIMQIGWYYLLLLFASGSGGDFKCRQYIFDTLIFLVSLFVQKKRKKYGSSFEKAGILFTHGCFEPRFVKFGPVILEKTIYKYCQNISLCHYYLPIGNGGFDEILFSFTSRCFCQVWSKYASSEFRRNYVPLWVDFFRKWDIKGVCWTVGHAQVLYEMNS